MTDETTLGRGSACVSGCPPHADASGDPFDDLDELRAALDSDAGDGDALALPLGDGGLAAQRYLRALRAEQREVARLDRLFAAEQARLAERRAQLLDRRQKRIGQLVQLLADYHRAVIAQNPARKTIHLPGGTLSSKAGQPRWNVVDSDAFIAWATSAAPDLVRTRTTQAPDMIAIKKALTPGAFDAEDGAVLGPGGEIVPGLTALPGERRFTVDVDNAGDTVDIALDGGEVAG